MFVSRLLFSFAALSVLSGPRLLAAQATPTAAEQARFAGESVLIEHMDQVYSFNPDGTGYSDHTIVAKVQSEAAVQQLGVLVVPFASASQRVEFKYARVRRPDGSVIETPVSNALEQPEPVTLQAPFYSDLKQEQLPVKSLQAGDTLEWQARVVTTKAEAPGEFWGSYSFLTQDGVVLSESLELRVPAEGFVNVWTNPTAGAQPVPEIADGQKIYRWQHANLKPTAGKEAEAQKEVDKHRVLTADEVIDAEQGKLPSVAWTTFKSWADVGVWYRGLESDRAVPNAEIKAKVAELTAGKTTEEDKVRAVYAFVSTQVRYIGVAFGIGRYQPHAADAVLDNQYGDCKDKHTLLAAMLTALGLQPDAVLIGAGIRFNDAVPSPAVFNHLITRVNVGGQEIWLDSTAEVAPYRMLTAVIRDKQALVIPNGGVATVQRTPADPPMASSQDWAAVGSLDKAGVSESHITLVERGDTELLLRQFLRQVPPAQYDDFVQRMLQGIGYQGTASHPEISRPDDLSGPLVVKFDYRREQAGDWANYRIIPQLAPVSLPVVDEKQPPVAPLDLGTPRTETSTAEMKLPEGWGLELPEAVHEKTAFATYDLTYRFDNGTLYTQRKIAVLQQKVPADQWNAYKKWQDAVSLGNDTFVQLTHTGTSAATSTDTKQAPGSEPPAATPSSEEAAKLIQQAWQAIRTMDAATASSLLDQAKALNPEQTGLWGCYGGVAYLRGERIEALADYRKELALHPGSYWVYPGMAELQRMGGDRAAAEATLRSWSDADPANPAASMQLIAMLVQDGKTNEAVQAGDAALARLPEDQRDNPGLQLAVGQAEMKAGQDEKAADRMVKVLKTTEDPSASNSAAYLLAEANQQLTLAESSQRSTLEKLDLETQSWTLDESPAVLKQRTALLVASWDTMGWILFREGKLSEAESYVEAAWRNSLRSDVGAHLVQIRAAIANPGKAREMEQAKTIEDKTESPSPGKSNQELRTFSLGPAQGRQGVAEYRLLLTDGKVERAEQTGDHAVAGGTELLTRSDLSQLFPRDAKAKLVREAMLNCHSEKCDLVFMP